MDNDHGWIYNVSPVPHSFVCSAFEQGNVLSLSLFLSLDFSRPSTRGTVEGNPPRPEALGWGLGGAEMAEKSIRENDERIKRYTPFFRGTGGRKTHERGKGKSDDCVGD